MTPNPHPKRFEYIFLFIETHTHHVYAMPCIGLLIKAKKLFFFSLSLIRIKYVNLEKESIPFLTECRRKSMVNEIQRKFISTA